MNIIQEIRKFRDDFRLARDIHGGVSVIANMDIAHLVLQGEHVRLYCLNIDPEKNNNAISIYPKSESITTGLKLGDTK